MKRNWRPVISCMAALSVSPATVETVVLMRHAEKPAAGLGQLDCQGLNRALALPAVLKRRFGRPDMLFAPDPAATKPDGAGAYDYVRPLATIEPAAIAFGLPVDASIAWRDIAGLEKRLSDPALRNATVVVAWEHKQVVALARSLSAHSGGDPAVVPDWDKADFDGLYVLRIARGPAGSHTGFRREREGLDGQPTACPG